MKKFLLVLLILFAFLAPISILFAGESFAEESSNISEERLSRISDYCPTIRQTLTKIQKVDASTRTYLGGSYEIFVSNFITPLNLRLIKNNQPSSALSSIQTDFVSTRAVFNADFVIYSKSFEELLAIDCKSSPKDFYQKLKETREKRAILAKDIEKLRKIINKNKEEVEKLRNSIKVEEQANE